MAADLNILPPLAGSDESHELFRYGQQSLYLADCLEWLAAAEPNSAHAVITDPPYGLLEYEPDQQRKLRLGRGGVWRLPPSFDGASRRPLPRFTVLGSDGRRQLFLFFRSWAERLWPVIRPGGHVFIAGNPLVSPLVGMAMEEAGFERRREIVRLVRTFRGGDRPKGAHTEFACDSTMPRSCWQPWGLYRRPLECSTVAANLRRWQTGGLRRLSADTPFLDIMPSTQTPERERKIAPHPSVKPQNFLRRIITAALPLGEGTVLDPFAGCGTTLAACEATGITGTGIEIDKTYFDLATESIPKLARLYPVAPVQYPLQTIELDANQQEIGELER